MVDVTHNNRKTIVNGLDAAKNLTTTTPIDQDNVPAAPSGEAGHPQSNINGDNPVELPPLAPTDVVEDNKE